MTKKDIKIKGKRFENPVVEYRCKKFEVDVPRKFFSMILKELNISLKTFFDTILRSGSDKITIGKYQVEIIRDKKDE